MVKQLIELNKLEFGMDDSVITNVQLNKLIEKVVKNLDVLAPDIDFQIISKENVYVLFDEFKLEQIITNYLTNAIHYVDDRKQIRIRIEDGDKVKLSIFNTGTHISDDNLKRIWEKFYKIDKARTRSYGGSGIGLSIISAIMRKYGEDFGCENVQDGVEFYVYLRKQ
jgi:signal transduction histidine kinase